jgi:hypothetical protein
VPLRGYESTITLAESPGGGTDISWRSQFEPKVPLTGGLVPPLAHEAERAPGP